jgi:hypothetical protein
LIYGKAEALAFSNLGGSNKRLNPSSLLYNVGILPTVMLRERAYLPNSSVASPSPRDVPSHTSTAAAVVFTSAANRRASSMMTWFVSR